MRQLTTGNLTMARRAVPGGGSGLTWTPDAKEIVFGGLRLEDADYHNKGKLYLCRRYHERLQ